MYTARPAYSLFLSYVNEPVTGHVSEAQFEEWFNASQIEVMAWLLGDVRQYSPGMPEPAVQLASTQEVEECLEPFLRQQTVALTSGTGQYRPVNAFKAPVVVKASGWIHEGCSVKPDVNARVPVTKMNDDEWAKRTMSVWQKPTLKNPVWRYAGQGIIEVSPTSIQVVEMPWYENPPPISIQADTPIPWPDRAVLWIINRCLMKAGLNLGDITAMNYAKGEGA